MYLLGKSCQNIRGWIKKFLLHFLNKSEHKKIFFTLNQDLLLERQLALLIKDEAIDSYKSHLKDEHIISEPVLIKRLGFDTENIKLYYQPFQESWRVYYDKIIENDADMLFSK